VAAAGEYLADEARSTRLLYLTLSTGMGGGFVVDGRLYRGADGAHPEVAHQAVAYRCRHPERIVCECGADACLEALVSGNGIRRIYGVPAEQLDDAAWMEVAHNLGQGLRNLAAIYAPGLIVLGGSVALGGGARLLDGAVDGMRNNLRIVPAPTVRLSALSADSPLLGALALASGDFDS
jgi:predicted NBD/HSP70 family sugar kinase